MKKINIRWIALAILVTSSLFSNAQKVHTGVEAVTKYKHASVYRDSKFSALPSFIKFKPESQFDIDELPKWMQSSFKFDPTIGFELLRKDVDNLGHVHYRYQQTYNGTPIEDAIWIAHTKNDKVYSLNGLIYNKLSSPAAPGMDEATALSKALDHVAAETYKWELPGEEQHLKWETEDPEATYAPHGDIVFVSKDMSFSVEGYRLAYKFNIYAHAPLSRADIYVDAISGEILRENSILCHADEPGIAHTGYSGEQDIIADSFGSDQFRLRDASRGDGVRTFDMNQGTSYGGSVDFVDNDNDWDNVNPELDQYATDAHWGCEMTYDYYFEEHSRNSLDNAGFQLNSYVHFDVDYDNAFWDGSRMTYGDGDVFFTPLTGLDVCGHEVTHGLTNFTAGLIYADESGALNESFSDIFGTAIEHYARPDDWDWLLGEEIGLFGALRSLINPNDEGDPDTYFGDYWAPLGGGDAGGVHTNSGVQNFWYYLLTEGGTGTNDNGDAYDITGIGFEASDAIAFRNLTVYLTPSSQFADARFYAIESATDLFGVCSFEVEQTANAWYAVGVGDIYNPETVANFTTPDTLGCAIPHTVNFTNMSTNAVTYTWDFGDGETSTDEDPSHTYTEAGTYTITLFADGGDCGSDEVVFTDYILVDPAADCIIILPESGSGSTQVGCEGTVYDSGGPDDQYGANQDAWVTLAPFGAISIDLTFPMFDVEAGPGGTCNYDYLEIYDGPDVFSPLIGRYCNNNLPSDLTSSGSTLTLLFHSDGGVEDDGFVIEWSCNLPEFAPETNFTVNNEESCSGLVFFSDLSTNAPTSWAWDFGDGEVSSEQNPEHLYAADGIYTVSLEATNIVGGDTEVKTSYITVHYPENPTVPEIVICADETATLVAAGEGTINWYDSPVSETPIETGPTFITPVLDATTSYWVEDDIFDSPEFVGPLDNTFGGGGYFSGDQHLVFNNPTPVTLKSVDVYADGAGNRIIELRNNVGDVLESRTINIPDGASTVILDMDIPAGTNLQLGTALGSAPALYRNNSGVPAYPYVLDESIQILSSSAGDEYYYFFYNWEIHKFECVSDRVEVVVEVEESTAITVDEVETLCLQSEPVIMNASEPGGTWSATCGACINEETGAFSPSLSGVGSWVVTYSIGSSCLTGNSVTISVVDCLGLEGEYLNNITIYPNPTNGIVTINTADISNGAIIVKDVLGKTVVSLPFYSNSTTIDLNNYQARGTYFVELYDGDQNLITVKKIIKH